MNKEEYKNLINKIKYMVENYPEHPGMEKILSLWKKTQNKNIIFLFEKDVIEEVERLYNEIVIKNTVISIDLDNEINLKENVDWLKENFEYISQLVSDQLHIDVEVARNILSNTIKSIEDENELKVDNIVTEKDTDLDELNTVKIPFSTNNQFVANDDELKKSQTKETNNTDSLLSKVLYLLECYNKVIEAISILRKDNNDFYTSSLPIIKESDKENEIVFLKIPFENKGQMKILAELLIESFGDENNIELLVGCDFLTISVKEKDNIWCRGFLNPLII